MKNKGRQKTDYTKLKRKIVLRMLLIVFAAIVMVLALREMARGRFANWFVNFLSDRFYLAENDAGTIYQFMFRNNLEFLIILAGIGCAAVFYRFSLSWQMKYFDQIQNGIDQLIESAENEIILPSELESIANKLNQVRAAFEKKTRDANEAEQRKNDLVVYLAHDIKTPLTSVIGYLSLLDEAPDMPAEQRAKYIGITLEKAYRLEDLINEFFDITRFNLESIILNKSKINLALMLQQMADEFYPILSPQGKRAVVTVPEHLLLLGDADKLARVFNNILKNAAAYSYENSVIHIAAANLENRVSITFTNQGHVIAPQSLNNIFEKFYRLDSSRSTNTGGAGLGLAIAKEIVAAHGGTISAESSEAETTFTVTLPNEQ